MGDAPVTRPGASFVVIHSTLHDPTDDRDGTRVRLEPRTHRSRVSALPRALVVLWTRNTRRLDARTLAVRLSSDACIPLRQPDVTRGPETRAARRARSAPRRSPCDGSRPNKVLDTRLGVTSNERNVSRRLRRCRGQGLAYHGLGLLQDTAKMFCALSRKKTYLHEFLAFRRGRACAEFTMTFRIGWTHIQDLCSVSRRLSTSAMRARLEHSWQRDREPAQGRQHCRGATHLWTASRSPFVRVPRACLKLPGRRKQDSSRE